MIHTYNWYLYLTLYFKTTVLKSSKLFLNQNNFHLMYIYIHNKFSLISRLNLKISKIYFSPWCISTDPVKNNKNDNPQNQNTIRGTLPWYLKRDFIEGIAGLQRSTLKEPARAPVHLVTTVHGSGCWLRLVRIGPTLPALARFSFLPLFPYLLRLTAQVVQPEEVHWHLCSGEDEYTRSERADSREGGRRNVHPYFFRANEYFFFFFSVQTEKW